MAAAENSDLKNICESDGKGLECDLDMIIHQFTARVLVERGSGQD